MWGWGVRLEAALKGESDAMTLEALDWAVTSHLRSRYVEADVGQASVIRMAERIPALKAAPPHLQAAAYMHYWLADLGAKYGAMRRAARAARQHSPV